MNRSKLIKGLIAAAAVLGTAYAAVRKIAVSKSKKKKKELNQNSPYTDKPVVKHNTYEATVKEVIDKSLAFCGLILLLPVYLAVSAAIYIDDPGPVLFTQKRVGKNKEFFELHKFRSMKMSTPHDIPTHMLDDPEQYITRVGRFIRKYSIDELPQIWDIFSGDMAIVGPRPALYNQDDLIAERDRYGANDVKPGLTGLAQISGRDELEIGTKAKIDGDYVKALKKNSISGFAMDIKCFLGTITSVLRHEGVVEGGTGKIKKAEIENEKINTVKEYADTKVSVIIPTYKRSWFFLKRALDSVLEQTYQNIEAIVIDDSPESFEERQEIIEKMTAICESDSRVVYLINEKNMGGSLARNRGIEAASGELITFLDDDDEYLPEKVEHQVKFMLQNDCDLSFEDMTMYDTKGKIVDYREYKDIASFDNDSLLKYHLMKHMTGTPTFMFKAEALRRIGGFEDAKMGQEFYLMLKAIERGLSIQYFPVCDIKVYKHGEGITHGKNKIDGENRLYDFKKQYFNRLTSREISFIKFRHHAVMAVAYLRNKQYYMIPIAGLEAFVSSPVDFVQQVTGFITKVVKRRNQ